MKRILEREDVEKAIRDLEAVGKKPTLQAIHAMLENRGSVTTLMRIKAEIDTENLKTKESEAVLRAFRELRMLAIEEGRAQRQKEYEDQQTAVSLLTKQIEEFEKQRVADLEAFEKEKAVLEKEIEDTRNEVSYVRMRFNAIERKHAKTEEEEKAIAFNMITMWAFSYLYHGVRAKPLYDAVWQFEVDKKDSRFLKHYAHAFGYIITIYDKGDQIYETFGKVNTAEELLNKYIEEAQSAIARFGGHKYGTFAHVPTSEIDARESKKAASSI